MRFRNWWRVRIPLQITKFVVVDEKKTLDCGVSKVGKRKKRDTCVRYSVKCWCTREEKHLTLQCQIVGLGMERDT